MLTPDSIKQPFWAMKTEEALKVLETIPTGLAEKEISARRTLFGANDISVHARLTAVKIFLNQFYSPLILVLLGAGSITFILREWTNTVVILAAVAVNTALGFYQENKAETALEVLKSYIRTRTRVKRSGQEHEIDAAELAPGDLIRVLQGDRVPADARLIFANSLEADESVLTGESQPVEKTAAALPAGTALAERKSMLFSGTLVVQGFGDAVVTATGNATEFGQIAALVEKKDREQTPLQAAITRFTVRAGGMLGILISVLFGLGIYAGLDIFEMFLIGVAVAVSAVPEGLPIALTVILAVGVQRLAKKNGVVRKLLAAETLGSASLILTDKTGTLTQAKMEIARVLPYQTSGLAAEKNLLLEAVANTDVVVENPEAASDAWRISGRALEAALVRGAAGKGVNYSQAKAKISDRVPFSSTSKFSAVIMYNGTEPRMVMLGAPDILLQYTNLNTEEKKSVLMEINGLATAGERVLGVVSKALAEDHGKINHQQDLRDFQFTGLLSFRDPLRPNVRDAIQRIWQAGVKTVIVTGDHQGTAEAVARDLGLIDGKGAVLTGADLNYLKKEELYSRAAEVTVFARVTPEQKVMITELYKSRGEVVAVTGDGVNDAPALQTADIGIAVGSGTDVAKSAADLVLLDDNFETIVAAIEEGRRILDNIRKVIVYLLSTVFDELLLIGGALLMGLALPLSALQILFVNFFSDSFPAIGFAFEKGVDGLGSKPKRLQRNLFDRELRFMIFVIGIFTSAILFLLYYYLQQAGYDKKLVQTFVFATFATYSLFLVFPLRSLEKSIAGYNPFSNYYLLAGVGIGLGLTLLSVYEPNLQKVFGTVALPWPWLAGVAAVGFFNIMAVEIGKWLFRSKILNY